jgi:site-specific recombinase XerD
VLATARRLFAAAGLRPATVARYAGDLEQYLAQESAGPVTDCLAAYRDLLLTRYAPSTVNRKLSVLRRFYALAAAADLLPCDPATHLTGVPLPQTAGEQPLSDEIRREVFDLPRQRHAGQPKALRDLALLHTLTLLTVAQARALDIDDVALPALRIAALDRVLILASEVVAAYRAWIAARTLLHPATSALFISLHTNAPAARLSARGLRGIAAEYGVRASALQSHTS